MSLALVFDALGVSQAQVRRDSGLSRSALSRLVVHGVWPARGETTARKSLEARGDGANGWSLAWKINLWARLGEGDRAHKLLAQGHTPELLALVFQRIYTLRNQLMHGGATWNSMVNRAQLQDCVNLMGKLVPVVIEIMLNSSDTIWGDACYPVINS